MSTITTSRAQELLQALGNPAHWRVTTDRYDQLECDRVLVVEGYRTELRVLFNCAQETAGTAAGRMDAAVAVIDRHLAQSAAFKLELLPYSVFAGRKFFEADPAAVERVLDALTAQCRFADAEEVVAR